ncbi:MAG: hypothetical protein ACFFED_03745 [Candidatus Thorarchaeota archaeon]
MISAGKIVWQTDNWNLVDSVSSLLEGVTKRAGTIEVSNIPYQIGEATGDSLIATSTEGKGHVLMAKTKNDAWFVAWATPDSISDLTIIDLKYAASKVR